MFDALIQSTASLEPVSLESAIEFSDNLDLMCEEVDRELTANPHLRILIGGNHHTIMYDHHHYFGQFMATVFICNSLEMLARISGWFYKSYHAQGFAYDYFPVEFKAWQQVVHRCLSPAAAQEINRIYQWLLDNHAALIELSGQDQGIESTKDSSWEQDCQLFLTALVHGDWEQCLRQAGELVQTPKKLKTFYLQVLQPCMYLLGDLWEKQEISVVQEQLASAIVNRVMATIYTRIESLPSKKGKILVTTAPNEFHEIGARMLADCLELDGWEVDYLRPNILQADLLDILSRSRPFLVAFSITMPFNLIRAQEIIAAIRNHPQLQGVRVLVGGRLFHDFPNLWQVTGADAWAPDITTATAKAQEWWSQRETREN